jgi:hypothetical protein
MLEPGIDHLLDTIKLRPPKIAHFVETRVHVSAQFCDTGIRVAKPLVGVSKPRIHIAHSGIIDQDAHQHCEHCRHGGHSERKDLGVAHL